MEWQQGLCMEPLLGPPSCILGIATKLMYGATRTPPHVFMELPQGLWSQDRHAFMEWPQGLCMEPPSCVQDGHKACVWSH